MEVMRNGHKNLVIKTVRNSLLGGVEGSFKINFKETGHQNLRVWIEFSCLRIQTNGRLL
jgi:hypothetical protein